MATGKNTKGKANGGGSRAHARYSGLMALESRVLFSAAPLMADLPGLESAHDGAPAIEASLLPGDKPSADLGQINGLVPTPPGEAENQVPGLVPTPPGEAENQVPGLVPTPPGEAENQVPGLVPTPPGEAENQVPGLVPTPEKHLTHHQSKDAHLNQVALKKHTYSIINPQFKGRGDGGQIGIPCQPPIPELSDSVSKRRLEHGPGLHDSVLDSVGTINPDSMRPTANSFRGCVPTDPCTISGQTIGKADSFFDIFTELSRVGDEPRDIVFGDDPNGSAQVVDPDSMRPTANIWTDGTMTNLQPQIGSEHFPPPGLRDSILDSVGVVDPDSMRPADTDDISDVKGEAQDTDWLKDHKGIFIKLGDIKGEVSVSSRLFPPRSSVSNAECNEVSVSSRLFPPRSSVSNAECNEVS